MRLSKTIYDDMAKKRVSKQELFGWDEYLHNIMSETPVDSSLNFAEKERRRIELEEDPVAWCKEMFPNYAKKPFAKFHIKLILRITRNMEWYEVLSWARELAKSTVVMMVVMYLILTKKKRNVLLVSSTIDNAVRLLRPYRANLQANQRIKFYYGKQQGAVWTEEEFVTTGGVAFRALGAGNAPRGTKNDEIRPDILLTDDFDTDEACRNPDTVDKNWKWWEKALYFTRSMSEPLLTIWCGNIIAEDSCITRAGSRALELAKREKPIGNWDIINIRMVDINHPDPENDYKYGTSVWPDKNTEEQIDIVLSQVSSAAAQQECFNNPVKEGEVFNHIIYGTIPPLQKFTFLIAYGDPSTSNKKTNKSSSYKAITLLGVIEQKLYIIYNRLARATSAEFVQWFYEIDAYVGEKTFVYNFIENNKLQDPFYQQVFVPLFSEAAKINNKNINISPDLRNKPDKYSRIEGSLEPLNRDGKMIFNIKEKDNPHMKLLDSQFKSINPRLSAPADGPDSVEGGYWIANTKLLLLQPESIRAFGKNHKNKRV